jgi:hypothetical protein
VDTSIAWLLREGATGGGRTSWGSTGFAFVASEAEALRLVGRAPTPWPMT